MSDLRIGVIAPITHPVPPAGYGPWERVVSDLVEELVNLGHEVTLFAAAGSTTTARLVTTSPFPLSAAPPPGDGGDLFDPGPDPRVWEHLHVAAAAEEAATGTFDVVHSHLHVHALGFARLLPCPLVSTLHGSAWNRAHHPALLAYREQPYVSLSDAERRFLPDLNYVATVPNGIRLDDFPPGEGEGGYLLFAGRMAPEKAPDLAIETALRSGRRLVLAGGREAKHETFFAARIAPHLAEGRIDHVGPVSRVELATLYREAAGLIMPLRWDEPFGLVVVESLASGTPVIAWNRGAMPELIDHGSTGFLVSSVEEAAEAVHGLDRIDRAACRAEARSRFGAATMATGYVAAYRQAIDG